MDKLLKMFRTFKESVTLNLSKVKVKMIRKWLDFMHKLYGDIPYVELFGEYYPYSFYKDGFAYVSLKSSQSALSAYARSKKAHVRMSTRTTGDLFIGGLRYEKQAGRMIRVNNKTKAIKTAKKG